MNIRNLAIIFLSTTLLSAMAIAQDDPPVDTGSSFGSDPVGGGGGGNDSIFSNTDPAPSGGGGGSEGGFSLFGSTNDTATTTPSAFEPQAFTLDAATAPLAEAPGLWEAGAAAPATVGTDLFNTPIELKLEMPTGPVVAESLPHFDLLTGDAPPVESFAPFYEARIAPAADHFQGSPVAEVVSLPPTADIKAGDFAEKLGDIAPEQLAKKLPDGADPAVIDGILTELRNVAATNPDWTLYQMHQHFYGYYSGDPMSWWYYNMLFNNSSGQRAVTNVTVIRAASASRVAARARGGSARAIRTARGGSARSGSVAAEAANLRELNSATLQNEFAAAAHDGTIVRMGAGKKLLIGGTVVAVLAGGWYLWHKVTSNEGEVSEDRDHFNPYDQH